MFSYLEVEKVDPGFQWLELVCEDLFNDQPIHLRLAVSDVDQMVADFRRRYQSKLEVQVNFNGHVIGQLNAFFQDFLHVRLYLDQGKDATELKKVAQTNRLDFQHTELSTLKKSLASRVQIFLEEACQLIDRRELGKAYRKLDWVHLIQPSNEMAYEMKMVILRSRQRYGECVTLVEQWIDCCPERDEAYLGLGELWLFLDQNQKALETFSQLLDFSHHNCMAQIGLAQAQVRLGKDFVSTLMKASVWDSRYTKEMVEHSFDFRTTRPDDLVPMTLEAVAEHFMIPLKRIMGRALRGVLPFHRKSGSDLLLFSETELRNYYKVLKSLGLEMATKDVSSEPLPREPEAFQPSLFDGYDEVDDS